MVDQTIKWQDATAPNIIGFEIWYCDTSPTGTYTLLTLVPRVIPGPNWDTSYFFYVDSYVPYRWYRLKVRDQYGNTGEDTAPNPFQAGNDPVVTPVLYTQALNENTGGTDNLRLVTSGGTPVEGATIRVYKKADYDLNLLTRVIGITQTNASGRWETPIFAETGQTYTIIFNKPYVCGPDKVEVTI